MLMEKKIIKVVFDDKLNYTFLNLESLRLGSNGSVEMWFNFKNYESGSTYKLAEVINVDIICTDGVIKRGQKFDSNYNMI